MRHDYLVVGCGLFGAVFARLMAEAGLRVLIVDQRDHVGGNCYSRSIEGIDVHCYGPHIFHTDNEAVWKFVNRFVEFNHYRHRGLVNWQGRLLSFPINLMTLHQLWGVANQAQAQAKLAQVRIPCDSPKNLEQWILAQVGRELYETFVRGYTAKQWGRDPKQLPASIIRRIPIRQTYNDRYFDDRYEGIPIGGYARLFENMLDHPRIRCQLGVDFFDHRRELQAAADTCVYTGKIDQFFDYRFGQLEYRSLRFEQRVLDGDFQGHSIINYTAADVPYTRIVEHKHFAMLQRPRTVVTYEYPQPYDETKIPYYPVRDEHNAAVYLRYRQLAAASGVVFGGRLGAYMYYDMHQVVAQAMESARQQLAIRRRAAPRAA